MQFFENEIVYLLREHSIMTSKIYNLHYCNDCSFLKCNPAMECLLRLNIYNFHKLEKYLDCCNQELFYKQLKIN